MKQLPPNPGLGDKNFFPILVSWPIAFTTSSMQIEANRKLGLSASQTMRTAQKLYEAGMITYMRTDSVHLSSEAITASRNEIKSLYDKVFSSNNLLVQSFFLFLLSLKFGYLPVIIILKNILYMRQ